MTVAGCRFCAPDELCALHLDKALLAAFDPTKHPHEPGGSPKGGQWAMRATPPAALQENLRIGSSTSIEGTWNDDPEALYFNGFRPQLTRPYADTTVTRDGKKRMFDGPAPVHEGVWWKASYYAPKKELRVWVPNDMGGPHHFQVAQARGWKGTEDIRDWGRRFDMMGSGYGDNATIEFSESPNHASVKAVEAFMQLPGVKRELRDAERMAREADLMTANPVAASLEADALVAAAVLAAFDPTLHPHRPGGDQRGGEWAPTETGLRMIERGELTGFPEGALDERGRVLFWPKEIGSRAEGPFWKAIAGVDGRPKAFWFADEMGNPHHVSVARVIGDRGAADDIQLAGFGTKVSSAAPVATPWSDQWTDEQKRAFVSRYRRDIADARDVVAASVRSTITPEDFTRRVQAGTRMAEVAVTQVLADRYARALRSIAGDVARRFKRQATSLTAAFDEAKHPRNPATGRDDQESPSDGGKFKSDKGGSSAAETVAKDADPKDRAEAAIAQTVKLDKPIEFEELPDEEFDTAKMLTNGKIGIHSDTGAETQATAIAHEYGHYLDSRVLGNMKEWATQTTELDPLYQSMKNSPTMKAVATDQFKVLDGDTQMRNYFLNGREMFARAFAQHVAITSGDPVLMKALKSMQADKVLGFQVWQDDEFAPIQKELVNVLKTKGLTAAVGDEYADEQPEPMFTAPDPEELVPKAKLADEIDKRTRDIRAQVVAVTVGGILTEAGIEFDVGGIFARRILDDVGARLRDADLSTRDAIRTVIDQGQAEGWTVPQTAAAIKAHITELSDSTAIQLARTDLIGTSNASAIAAARMVFAGEPSVTKRWLATEDERTRPTHVEADGQIVPLDAAFNVGDSRLDFPGDPSGPDAEVCNCRCTLLFEDEGLLASAWRGIVAAFDPSKHPHRPAGDQRGGEWAPKAAAPEYVSSDATGWDDPRWASVRERYDDWPFEEGDSPTSIGSDNPDGALADMAAIAGYDGLPRRMTAAEMDNLPEGWVRVWRGVDNADQAVQFRSGDYWAGKGAFGNGTYFTDMQLEADGYAGLDGVVIEAVIPTDALISDHATMENIAVDARRAALDAAMPEELRGDRYRVEQNSWRFDESQAGRHGSRLLSDPGRTAVSRGVDGYKQGGGFGQGGGTFYVIQNRTAVFVSDRYLDRAAGVWRSYETGEAVARA